MAKRLDADTASNGAALIAVLLSLIVLLGWLTGVYPHNVPGIGQAAMVPTTSLCLFALSLWAFVRNRPESPGYRLIRFGAFIVVPLALSNMILRQSLLPQGLDQLLPLALDSRYSMSTGSSLCIIVASLCLGGIFPRMSDDLRFWVAMPGLSMTLAIAASKLTSLAEVPFFSETSIMTAVTLTLLFFAAIVNGLGTGNEADSGGDSAIA